MAESLQNLDTILRGWAKDEVQRCLVETVNRYDKQELKKKEKAVSF